MTLPPVFQPITPLPGGRIGPGQYIRFDMSPPPVDPATAVILLQLAAQGGEKPIFLQRLPFQNVTGTQTLQWQMGAVHDQAAHVNVDQGMPLEGEPVRLTLTLEDSTGIAAQEHQDYTWAPTSAIDWEIADSAGGTGGLTEEQAAQLEAAATQTVRTFVQGVEQIAVPVSNLLRLPELVHLAVTPTPITFDAPGLITNAQLNAHLTFGLWWEFITVPERVGRAVRTQVHYQSDLIELAEYGSVFSGELATRVSSWSIDRVVYTFAFPSPREIHVWVFPGVVVNIHTLVLA